MIETLGIISSIIGIVGVIWGIIKFVLGPYLEKKRSCRKLIETIEEHFQLWKDVNYSFRANSLLKCEEFLKVNRYRYNFRKINEGKLIFLLRNAIQCGLSGDWGYWLVINKSNKKIIESLIPALDGTAGWRPIWRSAFILEKTVIGKINSLYSQIPDKIQKNKDFKFVFEIMKKIGTLRYLRSILDNDQKELKEKAQKVLQEIDMFSEQIEEYTKNRMDIPSDLHLTLKKLKHYPKIETKVFDFIIEMNRADIYSIHQIYNACNVYTTYLAKAKPTNLEEVSADIFGCKRSDIVDLEFSSYIAENGKSYVMRGFVPKNFLQNCKGIKKITEKQRKDLIVVLQQYSSEPKWLFTFDEMVEMFACYVLPVSYWWYDKEGCFFNPSSVKRAGLA